MAILERTPERERGVAALEMAIITPLLLILLMGVAEFGRLLWTQNTLNKLVRDGVRYLASNSTTVTGEIDLSLASDTARNLVVYGAPVNTGTPLLTGLSTANVAVSVIGDYLVVSTSYTYAPLFEAIPLVGTGIRDVVVPTQLTVTNRMHVL